MMSAPTFYVGGHKDPLLHAVYDDDLEIGHVFAHDDERAHLLCWWARRFPPSRRA